MININDLWTYVQNQASIWRTGFLSPSRFNAYTNSVSLELFTEKYLSAAKNQKLDDDLNTFHVSANLPVSVPEGVNYGLAEIPEDYIYFWNMRAFYSGSIDNLNSCGCPTADNKACDARKNLQQEEIPTALIPIVKEVRVTKVDSSEWDSVLNHRTKYPTKNNPFCTEFAGGFKIAPRDLSVVTLDYYKQPVSAVFGYTELPSGYYAYNAATSTNLDWNFQVFNEMADRIIKLFSVQVKNPTLFQMSDNLKQTRV